MTQEIQKNIPVDSIANRILVIRGRKVMLDVHLAELYQVETKALNRAVKRNVDRFPEDFMFQLTPEEVQALRYHIGTSNTGRGGRRYAPHVFTEYGALMLASVLNSQRAVEMSIVVVRAFARLRELLATHKDLARHLQRIEKRLDMTNEAVAELYAMIKKLMTPPEASKRKIGFV